MLVITCPTCQTKLQIEEQHEGRKVRCPSCGGIFAARAGGVASPPPPAPARESTVEFRPHISPPSETAGLGGSAWQDAPDDVPLPRTRPPREQVDDFVRREPESDWDDDFRPRRRRRRRRGANVGLIIGL